MTTIPTISDQLRACAAEVRRGWTQHVLEDSDRRVSVIGAIHRVVTVEGELWPIYAPCFWPLEIQKVAFYLATVIGHWQFGRWNDALGQTQEAVASAFDHAAVLAAAKIRYRGFPYLGLTEYAPHKLLDTHSGAVYNEENERM